MKALASWLVFVAAVLLAGAVSRLHRPGLDEGIALLADGDLDGEERVRTLRAMLPEALAGTGRRERLLAAAIALALDDGAAWQAACGAADAPVPVEAGDGPLLPLVDLGMPLIRTLFAARLAEQTGDAAAAKARYRQALAQARLAWSQLPERVAAAALREL